MTVSLRPLSLYAQIARTYAKWAPSLLLLAVIVFVPVGLVHTPFYAVAAVLLTVGLIREKDGGGAELHSGPPR